MSPKSSKSPFSFAASFVRALRGVRSRGGVVGGERSVAPAPMKSGGKRRMVLFCSTFDPAEDAAALRALAAAEPAKAERRLVVSGGPVETPPGIKGVRLDKHHAGELLTLHNLAATSGLGVGNPVHRRRAGQGGPLPPPAVLSGTPTSFAAPARSQRSRLIATTARLIP